MGVKFEFFRFFKLNYYAFYKEKFYTFLHTTTAYSLKQRKELYEKIRNARENGLIPKSEVLN
ncbi:LOW QUALITY PROTEIN: hypothetical protein PFNF135_06094 [Plasmodium falciparum NF135/5.C10]|uniref:Uncharacterized protein n=1 Tax=Plasmodium falciparum NF135/5.C10 TaxID=1036726 RepID=W4IAH9_PLAFA|nr:LOW QUALITY PROTEIN: hypothetical protein PFNF135_06094 [Plasmodium falciparum NF135/5.C10]